MNFSAHNRTFVLVIALLALICSPITSQAQTAHPKFPVTDGRVRSVAVDGGRVYVAGDFNVIGTPNGAGAVVDTSSGAAPAEFPEVHGEVYTAIADGDGGWYIGGAFDRVGDQSRTNLARIRQDLSVADWQPIADGAVRTLQRDDVTIFAGGDFLNVNGQPHTRIVALDPDTGAPRAWQIDVDGSVRTLVMHDGIACIGGDFTHVGGHTRNHLAAIDGTSGALSPWSPDADGIVRCLSASGETIYAGGDFTHVSGVARNRIAAVSLSNASLLAWNPNADQAVRSLAATPDRVYVGGNFRHIGGQERVGVAAISVCCAQALPWNPGPGLPPNSWYIWPSTYTVEMFALDADRIYLGGNFTVIGGKQRLRFAAFDMTSGEMLDWAPRVNGLPLALSISAGRAYIGGQWSSFGGEPRAGLAAIDRATEHVLPWTPDSTLSGPAVVAVHQGRVYAGGYGLVAIDSLSGHVLWGRLSNLTSSTHVNALAFDDSTIYVGEDAAFFVDRDLFAYRLVDGSERWSRFLGPDPERSSRGGGYVEALAMVDGRLYTGGAFGYVGDDYSGSGPAAVDPFNGHLLAGYPIYRSSQRTSALAINGDTMFASAQDLEAIDLATGHATQWQESMNINTMSVRNERLYIGGAFAFGDPATWGNAAALDVHTGARTSWRPVFSSGVNTLAPTDGVVYAGGDFTFVNGQRHDFLAAIDDTIPPAPVLAVTSTPSIEARLGLPSPNPFGAMTQLTFELPREQRVTLDIVDISGRRVSTLIASATLQAGKHQATLQGATLPAGIYWARLVTHGHTVTRKLVRLP